MAGQIGRMVAVVFVASAAGCFNGPRVATYLTAPPNQRFVTPYRAIADGLAGRSGATPIRVPVGPPRAELEMLILEPGDYGASVTTRPTGRNGIERVSRLVEYRTRSTTQPARMQSRGTIFLLHGYSAVKESLMGWGVLLAQHGYRCVLVDLRGHGRSSGEVFSLGKYETADMVQVLDYLSERGLCDGEVGVMGWSFGADLGLFWGARDRRVKTVVAIATYDRPEKALAGVAEMMHYQVDAESVEEGMQIAARKLGVDWEDWSGSGAARGYGGRVLVIRSSNDVLCTEADTKAILQATAGRSMGLTVQGYNHIDVGFRLLGQNKVVITWFDSMLGQRR